MIVRTLIALAAAAALALSAGCGSDRPQSQAQHPAGATAGTDRATSAAARKEPTHRQFVAALDRHCSRDHVYSRQMQSELQQAARSNDRQRAVKAYERAHERQQGRLAQLEAMRPPRRDRAAFNELKQLLIDKRAVTRDVIDGLRTDDLRSVRAAHRLAAKLQEATVIVAARLESVKCRGEFTPLKNGYAKEDRDLFMRNCARNAAATQTELDLARRRCGCMFNYMVEQIDFADYAIYDRAALKNPAIKVPSWMRRLVARCIKSTPAELPGTEQ